MVYKSLTDVPHNLKEGIDWLVALRGADAEKNLAAMGAAVYKFLADKPVGKMEHQALEKIKLISKEFLEKPELKEMWPANELLRRFKGPMSKKRPGCLASCFGSTLESDYKNVVQTKGLTAETIAKKLGKVVNGCEKFLEKIKSPDEYKSSYSSEATWEASCAKDPEACAVVLVGIAPMLYTGLRCLRKASYDATLAGVPYVRCTMLGCVLKAVGYERSECCAKISGSYVFKALGNVKFQMLVTLYDLAGFWAFY
ncbi:hypothetical protein, conserved [Babesia ovata]|uniref:Uncharacterized protein n=1 Tax=Babesia ovata TaxID=189622 RepID=A0A2H6KJD0_9APIC|nr:uncharacterized protein BOVATA_045840 [Babesia ovata]GBE63091.1 hypothetical protein, conserved [Babesia ovata]